MGVIFRDESNELSSTMIGYSDATVTAPNHPLIIRSNTSLATVPLPYHNCGGDFVIKLYLIPLISGQKIEKKFWKFFHHQPTHGHTVCTCKPAPTTGVTAMKRDSASTAMACAGPDPRKQWGVLCGGYKIRGPCRSHPSSISSSFFCSWLMLKICWRIWVRDR